MTLKSKRKANMKKENKKRKKLVFQKSRKKMQTYKLILNKILTARIIHNIKFWNSFKYFV